MLARTAVSARSVSNDAERFDLAALPDDVHDAQRVLLGEEPAVEVVEPAHAIHEPDVAGPIEPHVHDVPLGRPDHDALDPLFALVVPDVSRHDLHPCAGEREVERAGVRDVREEEAHDLAALDRQRITRLAVHEHHVAEPPHERVRGRRRAERHHAVVAQEEVVEHEHLLAMRPARNSRVVASAP